jgi:starch phosphorylase
MTASMNGSVNFSTFDGWICEFADHGKNSFIVPAVDYKTMSVPDQDEFDMNNLFDVLEKEILPTYYDQPDAWRKIVQKGMKDVADEFESNRMAREYYQKMYIG